MPAACGGNSPPRIWKLTCVGQKNTFFKKQTQEVIENKWSGPKNKPKQSQKQSGEVVENIILWKKQTQKQTGPSC
jgi:hypothetical protein